MKFLTVSFCVFFCLGASFAQVSVDTLLEVQFTSPREVVLADFNQDEKMDLFVTGNSSGVYFSTEAANTYNLSWELDDAFRFTQSVDVDADGYPDILACDQIAEGWFRWLRNTGTGWENLPVFPVSSDIDTMWQDDSLRYFLFKEHTLFRLTYQLSSSTWLADSFFFDMPIQAMEFFNANNDIYPDVLVEPVSSPHTLMLFLGGSSGFSPADTLIVSPSTFHHFKRIELPGENKDGVVCFLAGMVQLYQYDDDPDVAALLVDTLDSGFGVYFDVVDVENNLFPDIIYQKFGFLTDTLVLLSQGPSGEFTRSVLLDLDTEWAPHHYQTYDQDADGDQDILLLVTWGETTSLKWLRRDETAYQVLPGIDAFGALSFQGLSKADEPYSDKVFLLAGQFYEIYQQADTLGLFEGKNIQTDDCFFPHFITDIDVNLDGIKDPFFKTDGDWSSEGTMDYCYQLYYLESIDSAQFQKKVIDNWLETGSIDVEDWNEDGYPDLVAGHSVSSGGFGYSFIELYQNNGGVFEPYQTLYHSSSSMSDTHYYHPLFIQLEEGVQVLMQSRYGVHLCRQHISGYMENPVMVFEFPELTTETKVVATGQFTEAPGEQALLLIHDTLYLLLPTEGMWYPMAVNQLPPAFTNQWTQIHVIDLNADSLDDLVLQANSATWQFLLNDPMYGLTGTWNEFAVHGDVVFTDFDNNEQHDLIFFQSQHVLAMQNVAFDAAYQEGFVSADSPALENEVIQLYPNPAHTWLYIDMPGNQVSPIPYSIYNSSGSLMRKGQISDYPASPLSIHHLSPGLYTLTWFDGQRYQSECFVKW